MTGSAGEDVDKGELLSLLVRMYFGAAMEIRVVSQSMAQLYHSSVSTYIQQQILAYSCYS